MPRKSEGSLAPERLPSTIGGVITARRGNRTVKQEEQGKLQQALYDAEQHIRQQSLRLIDIEDLVTIDDELIAEFEKDRDSTWSRERIGGWVARLREARAAMINRDPPERSGQ